MSAFAINTVHICRSPGERNSDGKVTKEAVIEIVPAGAVFDADKQTIAELKQQGAVRTATKADIAAWEERNARPT